jgi:hypothetical protein
MERHLKGEASRGTTRDKEELTVIAEKSPELKKVVGILMDLSFVEAIRDGTMYSAKPREDGGTKTP